MKSYVGLLCAGLLLQALAAPLSANEMGRQVYQKWCSHCHDKGSDYPGTLALEARYKGAVPAALKERDNLAPELVTYIVRNGISVMPFFRKTEISDQELQALGAYLNRASHISKND
ncbi:c-type cytochrome [Pseudomonas sp. FME51]|uniref:c-type cytochrome n=1 Tax=Pseudomonas sp. FME51 TaxID=2742609 RepID=UPI0018690BCD|nr:cytochrome c [Pseudomonas sp. FME51]